MTSIDHESLLRSLRSTIVQVDDADCVVFYNGDDGAFEVGRDLFAQMHPAEAAMAHETLPAVRKDGVSRTFETTLQERRLLTRVSRVGSGSQSLCLATDDVTEVRTLQLETEVNKRQLDVALRASQMGLWSWHIPTGRVIWDRRMHELTGLDKPVSPPELAEQRVHPEDQELLRTLELGMNKPGPFRAVVARLVMPNGEIRWLLTSGTALAEDGDETTLVVGGTLDVTEHQQLAEKLRDARKMEAMGHLTAGVAHNFNNMLMVISPCLQRVRELAPAEAVADLNDAIVASTRAADVVTQLMTFAGQQQHQERTTVSADALCRDSARLCKRSFPPEIEVVEDIEVAGGLQCSPGVLEQVLSNVLFNARDALVLAGTVEPRVTITARDVERFDDQWVEILIADNGPGIANELGSKIFEPFVTTKAGLGTGLGLASSQAIVQQHGGQLACRPAGQAGTEFLILLPSVPVPSGRPSERSEPEPTESDTKRVFVVEDEPAIRRVVTRGLTRRGFEVATAGSTEEARMLLEGGIEADAVLLDMTLGTSEGASVLSLVRTKLPRAKVFYFTGQLVDESEAREVDGVIHKPVDFNELAATLRAALADG